MVGPCENCAFWSPLKDTMGLCQFNAPQVLQRGEVPGTCVWPQTNQTDMCGQWVSRKQAEERAARRSSM